MNIVSYHIISQKNTGNFNAEVRKLLQEGWQPYGLPAFFPTQEGGIVKYQAMVKPASARIRAHAEPYFETGQN